MSAIIYYSDKDTTKQDFMLEPKPLSDFVRNAKSNCPNDPIDPNYFILPANAFDTTALDTVVDTQVRAWKVWVNKRTGMVEGRIRRPLRGAPFFRGRFIYSVRTHKGRRAVNEIVLLYRP
jgi:hypothetical protein